jgi:hypothetical protein
MWASFLVIFRRLPEDCENLSLRTSFSSPADDRILRK